MNPQSHSGPFLARISCVRCGITLVDLSAVTITSDASSGPGGTCWVRCDCGVEMLLGIPTEAVTELLSLGVSRGPAPRPITRRDIRAFRRELARTSMLAPLAAAYDDDRLHR